GGHRDHATHDEGPSHGGAVDRLLLQADAHEVGGEPLGREALGQLDVVAQPVDGDVGHQISVPNWAEKRTSPSTMSCMSAIEWRSMSVRSMPMPNAKPVYSSGSTPAARSTLGLTMPQPPHSIQPAPPFFCGNHRSISADGSVNGKNAGRRRVRASGPNMARANASSVPTRLAMVSPLSTAMPSTWWKTGVCVWSSA